MYYYLLSLKRNPRALHFEMEPLAYAYNPKDIIIRTGPNKPTQPIY